MIRIAFDYSVSRGDIECIPLYFQGAIASCCNIDLLIEMMDASPISTSSFRYDNRLCIFDGQKAAFLAHHNLLTREYANISLLHAMERGDLHALSFYITLGVSVKDVTLYQVALSSRCADVLDLLLAVTDFRTSSEFSRVTGTIATQFVRRARNDRRRRSRPRIHVDEDLDRFESTLLALTTIPTLFELAELEIRLSRMRREIQELQNTWQKP